MDIINRTNNIPVKFDLYITVTSPEIKNRLENNINIVENKGREH